MRKINKFEVLIYSSSSVFSDDSDDGVGEESRIDDCWNPKKPSEILKRVKKDVVGWGESSCVLSLRAK